MTVHLLEATVGTVGIFAMAVAISGTHSDPVQALPGAIDTVEIAASEIDFPIPGEFLEAVRPAAQPAELKAVPAFSIMKQQVSFADYTQCVMDGACPPAAAAPNAGDIPVTGISFLDATAYARWLSGATGEVWRLPSALEAATAAAERFRGEAYSAAADDPANPAVGWLRRYSEEASTKRRPDPEPKPRGHFGPNSRGIEHFGGNVWEWTSTCYLRTTFVPASDAVESVVENCGVRVLEGRHRAYMSSFLRDGKSGGCAVGTPPENLGFRLVRERPSPIAAMSARLSAALDRLISRSTGG